MAAACAVICGVGVYAFNGQNKDSFKENILTYCDTDTTKSTDVKKVAPTASENEKQKTDSVNFAEDYNDIYRIVTNRRFKNTIDSFTGGFSTKNTDDYDMVYEEVGIEKGYGTESERADEISGTPSEHSETYNQEVGVLEADIVKTDGEFIYYLYNDYSDGKENAAKLNIAHIENESVSDTQIITITPPVESESLQYSTYIQEMYLYNDMLIVIGNYDEYSDSSIEYALYDDAVWNDNSYTFVNIYTTGINPELKDSYCQEGYYNDVRITPEGYMYLITEYSSADFGTVLNQSELKDYIPAYRSDEQTSFGSWRTALFFRKTNQRSTETSAIQ